MEETEKKYAFANEVPLSEKKKEYLTKFLDYCFKVLDLNESKIVDIFFAEDGDDDEHLVTTAYYADAPSKMTIRTENRAFIDIARSLAHELTHKKQFDLQPDLQTDEHSEGEIEAVANSVAGKIVRGFGVKFPEAYEDQELEEISKLKESLQDLIGKKVLLNNI